MRHELAGRVDVLTPNVPEARALLGAPNTTAPLPELAARLREALGVGAVLLKAGHALPEQVGPVRDAWAGAEGGDRVARAARAARAGRRGARDRLPALERVGRGLADGLPPRQAAERARRYLGDMLRRRARAIGRGRRVVVRQM